MTNSGDVQLMNLHDLQSFPSLSEQRAVSVELFLRKIVRDLRTQNTPYQNAVRAFQERYIVEVLATHAYHLGRTAEELGIHRNTLTRAIRDLGIDVRGARRAIGLVD
jgi:DNA-binding NtrC family response regulator